MPYGIKRDEQGNRMGGFNKLEEVDGKTELQPVKPVSPTLKGTGVTLYECVACAEDGTFKRYRKPAIVANHFKQSHSDLYENRESWRAYTREVKVSASSGRN